MIVDDQPDVCKGLQMRLAAEGDFFVIGEAAGCEAALELIASGCPQIVLIDAEMMHSDGIALAGALHFSCPQTSVIILSQHDDAFTRARAEGAGAAAFVVKSMPVDSLLESIRLVALT